MCSGHVQYPAFAPNTLLLPPALQKWQLEGVFLVFLSIICPNCACTQLFLVPYSFFVFCCSKRRLSRCRHCSKVSQVPGSSLSQYQTYCPATFFVYHILVMFPGLQMWIYIILLYGCFSIILVYRNLFRHSVIDDILTVSTITAAAVSMFVHISLCTCDTITLGEIPKVRFVAANIFFKILHL